jgi:hypothetical protein
MRLGIASLFLLLIYLPNVHARSLRGLWGYSFPSACLGQNNAFALSSHSPTSTYLLGLEYEVFEDITFEMDAVYATRGFQQILNATTSEISFQAIQIPILLRYYIAPTLSLGVGGYAEWGSYQDNSPAGITTGSYSASNYDAEDYGALFSLAARIHVIYTVDFLIEGRYLYGLKNISHFANTSIYLRDYQLLFGVSLF